MEQSKPATPKSRRDAYVVLATAVVTFLGTMAIPEFATEVANDPEAIERYKDTVSMQRQIIKDLPNSYQYRYERDMARDSLADALLLLQHTQNGGTGLKD